MSDTASSSAATMSLEEFRRASVVDDNTWWRLPCGDHHKLLDEALAQIDDLRAQLAGKAASGVGQAEGLTVAVTRSAGADGAVLVMIDTDFEPDGSDAGPGLRVLVNDSGVYAGAPRRTDGAEHSAELVQMQVSLAAIPCDAQR